MSRHEFEKKNEHIDHMVSTVLSNDDNYQDLLDMRQEEVEFLKTECDTVIHDLAQKIINEYQIIQPSLDRIRKWKEQLRKLKKKRNNYSNFLVVDTTSLMSGISANDCVPNLLQCLEAKQKNARSISPTYIRELTPPRTKFCVPNSIMVSKKDDPKLAEIVHDLHEELKKQPKTQLKLQSQVQRVRTPPKKIVKPLKSILKKSIL